MAKSISGLSGKSVNAECNVCKRSFQMQVDGEWQSKKSGCYEVNKQGELEFNGEGLLFICGECQVGIAEELVGVMRERAL